jgi:hypothetical protein
VIRVYPSGSPYGVPVGPATCNPSPERSPVSEMCLFSKAVTAGCRHLFHALDNIRYGCFDAIRSKPFPHGRSEKVRRACSSRIREGCGCGHRYRGSRDLRLKIGCWDIPDALYWDTADPSYHYVRLQPGPGTVDYLIVGGADHKSGEADDGAARFEAIEAWMRSLLPKLGKEVHRWSGQVLDTIDRRCTYNAILAYHPGFNCITLIYRDD